MMDPHTSQEGMEVDDKDAEREITTNSPGDSPESPPPAGSESNETSAKARRHMEKDDSGISVEKSENSSDDNASNKVEVQHKEENEGNGEKNGNGDEDDDSSGFRGFPDFDYPEFPKLKPKSKTRCYRKRSSPLSSDEENSNNATEEAVNETPARPNDEEQERERPLPDEIDIIDLGADDSIHSEPREELRPRRRRSRSRSNSAGSVPTDGPDSDSSEEEDGKVTPPVLHKTKPKHRWCVTKEVVERQRGFPGRCQGPSLFHQRCYGSLHAVQRLELMYKLDAHQGCVNALHFNAAGNKLASGSDDLGVVIWDWAVGKTLVSYDSGHKSNVFQVKFLPLRGDTHVVSCGRDGQVRLAELSSTGQCRATRRLAQHRGPAHKLSILPDSPHVFLSSGEDAVVMSVDVRAPKPDKLLVAKERDKKIALYSIHTNPLDSNLFCVSGRNCAVRIYDRRHCSESSAQPVTKFCPSHLAERSTTGSGMHVTCATFNHDGTELLASYNDEDIYLFDTRSTTGTEFIHKYEGHRNNATVKGVGFFGPRSEFVVSGSDCGNIYFWEKHTEAIVQWMRGDENGVVNCLEPHPQIPVIATSGLDDDVKIWVPSCEQEPAMTGLKSVLQRNRRAREEESGRDPDSFDGQMLWILWRHIRRTERRRGRARGTREQQQDEMGDSYSSDDSSNSSDGDRDRRLQCSPS
ncbi:DDB1- and CUL4-associated factor 8-like [Schistocerca nitens]|uniref:DDB1- and CUL4-associated factor 8-like n=1 Tax=Schistocerca nitens TaxID=7011 RepID=UPI002119A750|nr:DDB1- and CUL4-associated factor 8-like [Schistocerca nitens]XP_049789050.1 DDB1- and CUL4-associated factor 8-like [Schistocerca nitens]XP_049789051.1 DDB1- and CUL4-associated factor 8-like [Schistocerca nitens]